ncbi:MAG: membrane protein insertion efficiency factor YidD [Dehalococcoidia bacterium]|nr:membrane protein insertion efficiency factor YidD [Dehalococcoidia bacterium]
MGVACRYEPSCSHYAYESIERHGAWRGLRLGLGRLARCRPGGGSGFDPVPETLDRAQRTGRPESADAPPTPDVRPAR